MTAEAEPRYLLDVNVLIALLDPRHLHHDRVHAWFSGGRDWATCPLIENAVVRILSNPAYPTVAATPAQIVQHVALATEHPRHCPIPDDVRITDARLFDHRWLAGHKMVTDAYLLGLAHHHGLRLATLDTRLSSNVVVGAKQRLVEQLSG